ncbi:MAG: selenide, water dikinase SelD, partial [Bacteroidota bacterium]|nr:selenide, water dikinase SelD [Bacteroidota bacterium]
GGRPVLAIAILGWPINKLPPEVAQKVIEGARSICMEAGISLAGGHSIDSPEPIFGLAVNGLIKVENIKQNNSAQEEDVIFLTKPLGVGILTTAEKKGMLQPAHTDLASTQMMQLNSIGEALSKIEGVNAMTDVTGFGLLGHLTEMAEGSRLSAEIYFDAIPVITKSIKKYVDSKCIPGGTVRNWESYGKKIDAITDFQKSILADPQTSGGLLIAVHPNAVSKVKKLFVQQGLNKFTKPIGRFIPKDKKLVYIK